MIINDFDRITVNTLQMEKWSILINDINYVQ